jgi:hypothetical protein
MYTKGPTVDGHSIQKPSTRSMQNKLKCTLPFPDHCKQLKRYLSPVNDELHIGKVCGRPSHAVVAERTRIVVHKGFGQVLAPQSCVEYHERVAWALPLQHRVEAVDDAMQKTNTPLFLFGRLLALLFFPESFPAPFTNPATCSALHSVTVLPVAHLNSSELQLQPSGCSKLL